MAFCDICQMFLEKRQPQEDYPIYDTSGEVSFTVPVHSECAKHAPRGRMESERRHGEWSASGAPAKTADVSCAFCRKTIQVGQVQVDAFYWDFDGELDCIELAHIECAVDKGGA